jgi:hypothetical protein
VTTRWRVAWTVAAAALGAVIVRAALDVIAVKEAGSKLNMDESEQTIVMVLILVAVCALPVAAWRGTRDLPGIQISRSTRIRWSVGAVVYAVVQAALALPGWSWWLLDHGGPLALGLLVVVPLAPAVIMTSKIASSYV